MISQSQGTTEEVGTIAEMGIDDHSKINMVINHLCEKAKEGMQFL